METRVFINIDVEPFCANLIFPAGVPAAGYVRIIFGDFSKTCSKYRTASEKAPSSESDAEAAVSDKVFVQSPSVDGEPVCTLKSATLPDDLNDDSDDAADQPNEENESASQVPELEEPNEPAEPAEANLSAAPTYELSSDRRKQKKSHENSVKDCARASRFYTQVEPNTQCSRRSIRKQ